MSAVSFLFGWFLGLIIFYIVLTVFYHIKDKRDVQYSNRRFNNSMDFIKTLNRKTNKCGEHIIDNHKVIYDYDGNLIWDDVRGCVGISTYVQRYN